MADKNEEKRYKLWREIVKIDDKAESLQTLKRQYEQQLTHFHSEIQSIHHRMATLLSHSPNSRQVIEQIESENRTIQRQVNSSWISSIAACNFLMLGMIISVKRPFPAV